MGRIIFVTGTGTGVGKTILTALCLAHLRSLGGASLALKPFCSGGRGDAELLYGLQGGELSLDEVNPYSFAEPVAPLVAARKHRRHIRLDDVLHRIRGQAEKCDCLLVEGAGGLLAPLGEGFSALEIITELACETLVAASNSLGVINHVLLTTRVLLSECNRIPPPRVVLMNQRQPDLSSRTNEKILREMLAPVSLFSILYLGQRAARAKVVQQHQRKLKKVLASMVGG